MLSSVDDSILPHNTRGAICLGMRVIALNGPAVESGGAESREDLQLVFPVSDDAVDGLDQGAKLFICDALSILEFLNLLRNLHL